MPQWEYRVEMVNHPVDILSTWLNNYGDQGWEVVDVAPSDVTVGLLRVILKRPKHAAGDENKGEPIVPRDKVF